MKSSWYQVTPNKIAAFALLCVAATSLFLAYMVDRLISTLSSPDWCGKALQAERISPNADFSGLTACVGLLQIQLKSLATNSHIGFGVFAGCLLVLIVIVIAGGKLSFTASKEGVSGNIGKDAVEAAEHVVEGAQTAADEVKGA